MQDASLFTDQDPDDLFFSLVQGELDAAPYNVLWSGQVTLSDLTVTGRVIGASHIISYQTGTASLHEMLACVAPLCARDTYQAQVGHLQAYSVGWETSELVHRFDSRRLPWDDEGRAFLDKLIIQAQTVKSDEFGVAYEFPQGDLPDTPMTVIMGLLDKEADAVTIRTAHAYPGKAIVFSRSLISTVKK